MLATEWKRNSRFFNNFLPGEPRLPFTATTLRYYQILHHGLAAAANYGRG